jgi:hypothetical protein
VTLEGDVDITVNCGVQVWAKRLLPAGVVASSNLHYAPTGGRTAEARAGPLFLGPAWNHTLGAMLNDLRVLERHTPRPQPTAASATWENALPPLPGGQVVLRPSGTAKTIAAH